MRGMEYYLIGGAAAIIAGFGIWLGGGRKGGLVLVIGGALWIIWTMRRAGLI